MQTLSLENYGVSELSHSEQNETDGGGKFFELLILGVLDGIPKNTEVHLKLFGFDIF